MESQNYVGIQISGAATAFTIFIPLNHNDGHRIEPARLALVQHEMMVFARGMTEYAPGIGLWIDPSDKVYRDIVMPIQVIAPAGPEIEAQFARLATDIAKILDQRQIFLLGQPVWVLGHTVLLP